ncbi:MAG: formylglycine-generating enzyme family protein, partial [Coleofasciculaceae cyanobacterium RL_1_1]|nr:formylglycine-generating enzyme family protein [Coleofasciculaceae cyanobacterium RL_1_1]
MSAERFVEALARDCGMDAREIADLLWLVAHPPVTAPAAPEPIADSASEEVDETERPDPPQVSDPAPPAPPPDPSAVDDRRQNEADLAIDTARGQLPASTLPIRVPDPDVLDDTLPLVRALRPLLQQVEAGYAGGIDEVATVDRIAETEVWSPVLQPDFEPWFEVAIAIDISPSMTLWRRLLDELRRLLACYGGFRDLRVWELHPHADGIYLQAPSSRFSQENEASDGDRSDGVLLDPSVLRSADRRRLTIVFSDCTADYWWDGRMQPVLRRWGETMPVAVWQMLPDWMWSQAALGLGEYVTLRNAKRGATNAQLVPKFLSLRPFARVAARRGVGRSTRSADGFRAVVTTRADSLS